jgi:hypothetical protein
MHDSRKTPDGGAVGGRVLDPMRQAIHLTHLWRDDPIALMQELLMNPNVDEEMGEILNFFLNDPDFREWIERRRSGETEE